MLTERELGDMLAGFRASAFRFETRDRYNSEVGRESFRKFLAGEPDDYPWHDWWLDMIRRDLAAGRVWQRVRIVSVPVSDWSRYGFKVARLSVAAGEDIRYLARHVANDLGLMPYDSWLLDDHQLVHLHFDDDDDTFAGAELIGDREVVRRHRAWRDQAWQYAQTLEQFVAAVT